MPDHVCHQMPIRYKAGQNMPIPVEPKFTYAHSSRDHRALSQSIDL